MQNAVAMAMAASLSSATYDNLLRDVSCWVRDLRGSCGDVEAALREVAASRAEVDGQLAALGGAGDEEALPRALWLSEQYAAVEGRLAELQHRVAPIQEAVAGLATLHEYIQEAQVLVWVWEEGGAGIAGWCRKGDGGGVRECGWA